jgi:hypothetical protein
MITAGTKVIVVGTSTCSDHRLAGPALWQATIINRHVDEWHVLEDTPANRAALNIVG